jgi:hypothetical protein
MKLAIVGSRTFNDYTKLRFFADYFIESHDDCIISGGAKGADTLGEKYAEDNYIKTQIFPANWDKYGKSAGFIRNQYIVDACDIVLAFWDGKSHGTANTIEKARKAKKPTFIIYF